MSPTAPSGEAAEAARTPQVARPQMAIENSTHLLGEVLELSICDRRTDQRLQKGICAP